MAVQLTKFSYVPKEDTMNTFDYLAVACLFLSPYLLAIVAFRFIRNDAIARYRVYKWFTWTGGDSEWQYYGGVALMHEIRWLWPLFLLTPTFVLKNTAGEDKNLKVVAKQDLKKDDSWAHRDQKWRVSDDDYLIVRNHMTWSKTLIVLFITALLGAFISAGLLLNAHPGAFSARPTATESPIEATAEPTQSAKQYCRGLYSPDEPYEIEFKVPKGESRVYTYVKPDGEVRQVVIECHDGVGMTYNDVQYAPAPATVLVINLDQEASPSEIWEWLNSNLAAIPVPDLPINWQPPEWLVKLFGEPVTVIRLPEGMPGYVIVTYTEAGLKFIRTDDEFRMIGNPQFVFDNEATLQAATLHWGIEFDVDHYAWKRPTGGYKGNTLLIVFENVYDPTFSVRGRGWAYNLGYWPILGVAAILLIALAIYWWRNRY